MARIHKGENSPGLREVREYWNSRPLYSYEIGAHPGDLAFFRAVDRIKRCDVERFTRSYWRFEQSEGKRVLDIGCGPGWLSVQYAKQGARVTSVDLTESATELTYKHFRAFDLSGSVLQANAEELPLKDGSFDLVISSGVLHHTPDTERAIREACRVTSSSGEAKITLYYKGILHCPWLFPIVRWLMRRSGVKHPGADLGRDAVSADDFIRMYDGATNPIGRGYDAKSVRKLFERCGFRIVRREIHFFPARFVPFRLARYRPIHWFLDRCFGTMIYATLVRAHGQ